MSPYAIVLVEKCAPIFMNHLWGTVLGIVVVVGCVPSSMTEEEELARARAEKAKHPQQWRTPQKLTPAETTQQQRRWLEAEDEDLEKMIVIRSKYKHG